MPKQLHFLKTEQDFSNFKKSRSINSANFRIRWVEPRNQNHPRFGFIVPKKSVKKVTDRNLIKRRVKGVLSKHIQRIRPYDILFFPKPGTIRLRYADLERELVETLTKARVYENA